MNGRRLGPEPRAQRHAAVAPGQPRGSPPWAPPFGVRPRSGISRACLKSNTNTPGVRSASGSVRGTHVGTLRKDNRPIVSFAKLKRVMPMPNLLDVQLRSFEKLVESEIDPENQWDFGLDRVFGEIFPISDVNENFTLEYVSAALGEPKYSVEECIERDMTYAAPLKATLRLIVWEILEEGPRRARPGGPRTSSRRRSISVTSRS